MKRVVLALFVAIVATTSAFPQTELKIDLKDAGNVSVQVPPGEYRITIINMLPGRRYNVTSEVKPIVEEPVSIAQTKTEIVAPVADAQPEALPSPGSIDCNTILNGVATTNDAGELAPCIDDARARNLDVAAACARLLVLATARFTSASTAEDQKDAIDEIRLWGSTSGCSEVTDYAEAQCTQLLAAARTAIAASTNETELAAITAPLRVLKDACDGIRNYLESIERTLDPVTVRRGEMLTVTVVRQDDETEWVRNFSTGKRGEWLTGYGILLVPNRDASYTSYALGDDKYQIRRSRDRERFDYVPTLTFTFMRPENAPKDWFLSPVFGIGYDLQTISGTFGYALTYNHNFAISAGVMLHQQRRLKGKYEEGEHYTKTGNVLENADLTETTWAPNVYVGITIRSLTNPFAR